MKTLHDLNATGARGSTAASLLSEPSTAGYISGILVCAAAAGMLASGHASWALALTLVFTVAVTALVRPRFYRLVAFTSVFLAPFAAVTSALQPAERDYFSYVAAFAMLLVLLSLAQSNAIPRTIGCLYLAYLTISGFTTVLFAGDAKGVTVLDYILTGFAIYILVHRADRTERRVLVGLLLAFGVIQSILAVTQVLFGSPVFPEVLPVLAVSERNYFSYVWPGATRLVTQGSGTFLHFNYLGGVLALCTPLAFGTWLAKVRSVPRLVVFIILAAGLVATFSRGALLGVLVGVVLILLLDRSHSRRAMYVLGLCAAALGMLLAANTFAQYYETTQNVNIRVQTWQVAVNNALERPSNLLFGYGFDHFHGDVLSSGIGGRTATVESTIMAALHSAYLQIALEFGVVGLVLFALWLFSVARKGLFLRRSPTTVALSGAAAGFLCHQALDNSMFNYAGVLFVVVMALMEVESETAEPILARDQVATR